MRPQFTFATVDELVRECRGGRPVILCDSEERENEGDLVIPADHATAAQVNFMITHGRGLLCVAITPTQAARLRLSPMVAENRCSRGTAFAVSVDAAEGIGTGISARDRARTVQLLGNPACRPEALVSPGHVFPLIAHPNGLRGRLGHTEASVDLAVRAGCSPAAMISEVLDEDGEPMRRNEIFDFAARYGLRVGTVAALAAAQDAERACNKREAIPMDATLGIALI